jgi:hypothetical protein
MEWYIVYPTILVFLLLIGFLIAYLVGMLTCGKSSVSATFTEGSIWAVAIWVVYLLYNVKIGEGEYPSSIVAPIFSGPLGDTIGGVVALVLIAIVVTARIFHTVDIAVCNPTKDELKQFSDKLLAKLKK